jgi:hypothetical protein
MNFTAAILYAAFEEWTLRRQRKFLGRVSCGLESLQEPIGRHPFQSAANDWVSHGEQRQ